MWSRLSHSILKSLPINLIEFYIWLRMPLRAAMLADAKFEKLAPKSARIATGNYRSSKWDFPSATKFFLESDPETAVAILNQWSNHEMFKNIAFKAGIILNMMLTVPHNAFGMEEDVMTRKVSDIMNLTLLTNKPLIRSRLENGSVMASLRMMELITDPGLIPFLTSEMPTDKAAFLLVQLENRNPARFKFLFERFPIEKAKLYSREMNEVKINMRQADIKLREVEYQEHMKQKLMNRHESVEKLVNKISEFMDMLASPPDAPHLTHEDVPKTEK